MPTSVEPESLAKDLWAAVLREDGDEAVRLGRELGSVAPRVTRSSYLFPEDSPTSQAGAGRTEGELSPRGLQPDTPGTTEDLWNSDRPAKLGVFSRASVCGARAQTTAGTVDFPACALEPKECNTNTHKDGRDEDKGGKDDSAARTKKKKGAVVMEMPEQGEFLAIIVPTSSAGVKPRIFSRPILPLDHIPAAYRC